MCKETYSASFFNENCNWTTSKVCEKLNNYATGIVVKVSRFVKIYSKQNPFHFNGREATSLTNNFSRKSSNTTLQK